MIIGQYQYAGVATTGTIRKSIDGGITFNNTSSVVSTGWSMISSSQLGEVVMALTEGIDGFLYRSDDQGVTWNTVDSARLWRSVVVSGSGNVVWAVAQDGGTNPGGLYKSIDGGLTFTLITPLGLSITSNIPATDYTGDVIIITKSPNTLTSQNGGSTWSTFGQPALFTGLSKNGTYGVVSSSSAPNRFWVTSNSGVSWVSRTTTPTMQNMTQFQILNDGTIIGLVPSSGIYYSTDLGITFTAFSNASVLNGGITLSSDDSFLLYYKGSSGTGVYKATAPFSSSTPFVLHYSYPSAFFNTLSIHDTSALSPQPDPTFDPVGGTYSTYQSVTISATGSPDTIYYTTDGNDPTTGSAVYSTPILVDAENMTIKAFAVKSGYTDSNIVQADYTITPQTNPIIDPALGVFSTIQTVTITSPGASAIYYTLDGTNPTTSSLEYTAPFELSTTTTIKAFATGVNKPDSGITIAILTINLPQVAAPTFLPVAGTYTSAQSVAISTITSGASIYYTTDGSTPTYPATGTTQLYSSPLSVSSSQVIKALGVKYSFNDSVISTASYTINIPLISRTTAVRGVTYTDVALSVNTLVDLPAVSGNAYFMSPQKWKRIMFTYTKDFQHKFLEFRNTDFLGTGSPDTFPDANLRFSEEAEPGVWTLSRCVIRDFDGGSLSLGQSDLPSGLDITVS